MSSTTTTKSAVAASLPVGTRFNPTDEQLLSHYLTKKMQGKDSCFPEIDCCKHEPWDLLSLLLPTQDMERFFFSARVYKYASSKRSERATVQGYWKSTGKPRKIKARLSNADIGIKRILTFYEGRAPHSSKTNYIIHEYELENGGDLVLCRLKIKPHKYIASNFENQPAAHDMVTEQEENLAFKDLHDILFPNSNDGECTFSDFEMQQAFAQLESLLHPTQPEEQQDYYSSSLHSPKEAHLEKVPLADVNNGECCWGKPPLGDNDSCLTNKKIVSTNDNHEIVSNTASNFGSATNDGIPEVFTQPGENLEPVDYSLLEDFPLLSPMHTEPRDFVHGNNYIAGNELQSQFEDYDFSFTIDDKDYLSYLQTTTSPSIDSCLPKSLGTQSPFNLSFQGNSALATGEKKDSSVADEPQYFYL